MSTDEVSVGSSSQQLKYLGFLRVLALNLIGWRLKLYHYAKDHSGPAKPLVSSVEAAATTVLGPVFEKWKDVSDQILIFSDNQIDSASKIFDKHAPSFVKSVVHSSFSMVQKEAQLAQNFVCEARTDGFRAAFRSTVDELYQMLISFFVKFSELFVSWVMSMWLPAIKMPSLQNLAGTLLPAASGVLNKYGQGINSVMGGLSGVLEKGSSSLSSVPVMGGAAKLASGAALSAQDRVSNVVEQGTAALNKIPFLGDATKNAAKSVTNIAPAGTSAVSGATDSAEAAADAAASAANAAKKSISNVLEKLPFAIEQPSEDSKQFGWSPKVKKSG